MSQPNVDLIGLAYREGYAPRSVEGVRDRATEDFCFHMRPDWPGRPTYGLEEMTELWAELDETYSEYHLSPVNFVPAGNRVMVTLSQDARMRGSDARVESTIWHVWEIRDGKVREGWAFGSETEALEAAGLRE